MHRYKKKKKNRYLYIIIIMTMMITDVIWIHFYFVSGASTIRLNVDTDYYQLLFLRVTAGFLHSTFYNYFTHEYRHGKYNFYDDDRRWSTNIPPHGQQQSSGNDANSLKQYLLLSRNVSPSWDSGSIDCKLILHKTSRVPCK